MSEKTETSLRRWGDMPTGGPKHEFREGLMLNLFARALPGGRIFDAGAGDGTLTLKLAARGYRVAAMDASSDCLGLLAQKLAAAPFRERVELVRGSIMQTGLADNSFDGVAAGEVIEHFSDDAGLVREFGRLLKPGGICVVSAPADPKKWCLNDDWSGHVRRYHAADLEALFTRNGFETVAVHYWGWPLAYLFHYALYLPWLERHHQLDGVDRAQSVSTRVGVSPWVSKGLALAFRLDNLFNGLPYGIGLVGCFRKK